MILSESSITLTGSLIVGCGPSHYLSCYSCDVGNSYAYARSIEAHGEVQFESNTFVDNPIVDWYMGKPTVMESPEIYIPLIDLGDGVTGNISHNLFIGQTGPAVSGPATIRSELQRCLAEPDGTVDRRNGRCDRHEREHFTGADLLLPRGG